MKIHFNKIFKENTRNLIRKCGYSEQRDRFAKEKSYIRRIGGNLYPHFHIYLEQLSEGELVLNLHLDQKRPSYGGSSAHSGEYDGEIVEREAERIKKILLN